MAGLRRRRRRRDDAVRRQGHRDRRDAAAPIQVASGEPRHRRRRHAPGDADVRAGHGRHDDAARTATPSRSSDLDVRATEYTVGAERRGRDAGRAARLERLHVRRRVQRRRGRRGRRHRRQVRPSRSRPTSTTSSASRRARSSPPPTTTRQRAHWVPSKNGLVIKVLSSRRRHARPSTPTATADPTAPTTDAAHLDDAELRQLAQQYAAGKSLWRVEVEHFTPWDYNWPYGCAEFCDAAAAGGAAPSGGCPECEAAGSIIGCLNQTLGETAGRSPDRTVRPRTTDRPACPATRRPTASTSR